MFIYSKKKTGVYLYYKLIYNNVIYSKSNSAVRGNP